VRVNRDNLAAGDPDVHHTTQAGFRIDDISARQQKIVLHRSTRPFSCCFDK
jgi:hypothetical protein